MSGIGQELQAGVVSLPFVAVSLVSICILCELGHQRFMDINEECPVGKEVYQGTVVGT